MRPADRRRSAACRTPTDLGAENVGLKIDARGFIEVDDHCRTNLPNVYAIGDVVRGPMLAHKARGGGRDGGRAHRRARSGHVNFDTIPWVIYTSPEIAWVGKTEQQLKADGVAVPRRAVSRSASTAARSATARPQGFVKMLAHAEDRPRSSACTSSNPTPPSSSPRRWWRWSSGASSEDIARIVHAHPSLSEVMHEAALAVDKRALNM